MNTIKERQQEMPQRNLIRVGFILAVIALVAIVGALGYIWFSGGSGQPSSTTTAPSLALQPGDTRTLFEVTANESEVRFVITETLLGAPKTVIGTTDQVAGELLVDLDNPANSELGTIRINVRTLETDNELRTRALRGQILQAEQADYEFAQFVPSELIGLPDEAAVIGEPLTFQIAGNLTVHGITQPVTFDATLTPISRTQVTGNAVTTVQYQDFRLSIPEAPGVANVSSDVRLEIDFAALVK